MKIFNTFLVFLSFTFLCQTVFSGDKSKRLLVLYKASEGFSENINPFRNILHAQLDHQTYNIDYHNIEQSLLSNDEMQEYSAVLSWYTTSILKNPEKYLEWLVQQIFNHRKIIIIGNMGAFSHNDSVWLTEDVINRFYLLYGLEYQSLWTNKRSRLLTTF